MEEDLEQAGPQFSRSDGAKGTGHIDSGGLSFRELKSCPSLI